MKKIQLSIPQPCHQDWHEMTPTQQGRFCNSCATEVIDFSEMSDAAVLNYFKLVTTDKLCGRVVPDQLNRVIESIPTKKISWHWNYTMAFFLFFSKSTTAKAQGQVKLGKVTCSKPIKPVKIIFDKQFLPNTKLNISGIIQTGTGQAIAYASIRLLPSHHGVSGNEEGEFALNIDSLPCIIEVSSLGYKSIEVTINDLSDKKIVLLKTNEVLAEAVVTSTKAYLSGMMGGLMITRTIVKRNFKKDTIDRLFSPAIKIYPNPIMPGQAFTASLTLKQTGSFTIQIINAAGSILQETRINAVVKKQNEQLVSSETWSRGIYYIRVVDTNGKFIVTGNLVMQ